MFSQSVSPQVCQMILSQNIEKDAENASCVSVSDHSLKPYFSSKMYRHQMEFVRYKATQFLLFLVSIGLSLPLSHYHTLCISLPLSAAPSLPLSHERTFVNAVRKKSPLSSRGSRVKKLLVSPASEIIVIKQTRALDRHQIEPLQVHAEFRQHSGA